MRRASRWWLGVAMVLGAGCTRGMVAAALPALEVGVRGSRGARQAAAVEGAQTRRSWDASVIVRLVFRTSAAPWQVPMRAELSPALSSRPCLDPECGWTEPEDAFGAPQQGVSP